MQHPGLNPQFETELDAALKRAPEVSVPRHFSQRIVAGVPEPAVPRSSLWVLPALAFAAAGTLAALGIALVDLGWAGWLTREILQPQVFVAVLGIESVLSLAWVWRVMKSVR